jgi:hypothetical protein
MARDQKSDRASQLLEAIRPDLLRLLEGSPSHGSVGFELILHAGEITRIVSKVEVSRLPRLGGVG